MSRVIELGCLPTDFLDSSSLSVSASSIADNAETAGAIRRQAANLNHPQPADPDQLARVIVEFADAPNPPVRIPLCSDTVVAVEAKHAAHAAILAEWRTVSISTEFGLF